MGLEDEVWEILRKTYPGPKYSVIHHPTTTGLKWKVDFVVKKDDQVILALEVKDITPPTTNAKVAMMRYNTKFDNQMQRSFSQLVLRQIYLRKMGENDQAGYYLVIPGEISVSKVYENIFDQIGCTIIMKEEIPTLFHDHN